MAVHPLAISSRHVRPVATLLLALALVLCWAVPSADAAPRYRSLSALGFSAKNAVLKGRAIGLEINARRRVELRIAVVKRNERRPRAWTRIFQVRRGRSTIIRQLNRTPRIEPGLLARLTIQIGNRQARGFLKLKVIPPDPPPPPTNLPPTDIGLSSASIAENLPAGTPVGTLSATDPNAGDTFAFALAAGAGSTDNGAFTIAGDTLRANASLDFETKSSYAIRVRVTDNRGATFEKQFTITVTNANDAPSNIALSSSSVAENAPSGTVVGNLVGTDQDAADPLTFSLVSGTGSTDNASFAIVGGELRTSAVFDLETKASYSIRVRVSDGNGGTFEKQFTITVTNVNETPTDITLSPSSVAENQPSGTTVGALSSVDPDAGDSAAFTLVAGTGDADNASFQISGGTLRTNASFDFETKSSYTIRVRVTDGGGLTFEKQLTITITNASEPPTDIVLSNASVAENQPSGTTVGALSAIDPDAGETYSFTLVTGAGDADNGSFQISGSTLQTNAVFDLETKATYTIRVRVSDGNGGTFEEQFTITVTNANDAPTDIALSNASVAENQLAGTLVGLLAGTDQDPLDPLSFSLVAGAGDADNASFQISGAMLQTAAMFDFETKSSYSVRVRVSDGNGGTFEEQFTITVTDVNDAPTNIALAPSSVDEGLPAGAPVGTLSATDQDQPGDTFTFTLVAGAGDADNGSFTISGSTLQTAAVLDFNAGPTRTIRVSVSDGNGGTFARQLTVTVNNVNLAPTDIALAPSTVAENQPVNTVVGTLSATDPDVGDTFTFTLVAGTGDADNASFNIAGSSLRTSASFDFETKSSYSIRVQVNDGAATFSKQLTVTVTNANDAPTDIALSNASVQENQPSGTAVGTLSSTDQDAGATHAYALVAGPGSTDNAQFQISAGGVLQTNASLNFEAGATRSVRIRTTDNGGATFEKQFTITIVDANDAPVADDETFNGAQGAIGNTSHVVDRAAGAGTPDPPGPQKTITGDILAGDTDEDGAGSLALVAGTFGTTDGGSVDIEADGDFTFHPKPGTSCSDHSDSFDYTLTDQNTTKPPGTPATDVGTVTIEIQNCVWYVHNNAAGNDGTSRAPFDTLAQAETASASGDTIFVHDGDDTTTGLAAGIDLKDNQRLLGEAANLVIGADTLHTGIAANRPTITDSSADVVALASGNTVRSIEIDPSGAGGGIAGGAADAGGTIDDVRIIDTGTPAGQPGLELDGTSGTFDVSDLTVDLGASTAVRLNNNSGVVNFLSAGTISITNDGAKGLDVNGTNMGANSVIDDITVTNSSTGGVSMVNATGTTTFSNLALTTTSGTDGAFVLNNAGSVTVPSGGTANVSSNGGPAVLVQNTAPALAFDNVSVVSSGASGIVLDGLGAGTFSASGGTLAGVASGVGSSAFRVNGGSGAITYAGDIADGTGGSVLIQSRTGGTVTLSGTITDGPDVNGGPAVIGSSGGSTVFSGPAKTFSTGAGSAVSLVANTGHTVSFTGGNLDVDTTSGTGFSASSGGTVNVTGANNTIDTGTGNGLLVDNTNIGASDATFQRVSTNGAVVGIRANATGASGRLIVTGNGGTCTNANTSGCTGGQLANLTGADDSTTTPRGTGIVLNNTLNPSFTRMWIHDASNYGIRGTAVSGFTLANSVINGANGSNGTTPFDDSSVWIDNLTGSATVSDSHISGGFEDNFRVVNTAGSLNRITFTSATIGLNSTAGGNDGVLLETSPAAGQLHATVQSSTFTGAAGDLLQYNHGGTGTGDLVLTGNGFSNNHPAIATGGGGLSLFTPGAAGGNTTMSVSGNSFRDAVGAGVLVVKNPGVATQTGTFTNNSIGVAGVPNSGSTAGSALKLQTVDQGALNWTVTNNQIRGYGNFGVEILAGGGSTPQSGAINATITGNTITQPATSAATIPKNGVHLNIGTVVGDTFQACAVITGNSIDTSGADGIPPTGVNVDVRLRQRQSTTIRLPGYAGANNDNAAVQSFVNANNSAGTSTLAANTVPTGGGFIGSGTTCP